MAAAKKKTSTAREEPLLEFATRKAWGTWLAKHHASSGAVWLKFTKGAGATGGFTYDHALREALAWGWIDSQKGSLDEKHWRQRFGPRKKTSPWSQINCAKVDELLALGEMQPPGLREVDRAKADGRWARAYAPQSRAEVPADLAAALAKSPKAKQFFETLSGANRFAVLYRVQAKGSDATRAKRVERIVGMLERGESFHAQSKAEAKRASAKDAATTGASKAPAQAASKAPTTTPAAKAEGPSPGRTTKSGAKTAQRPKSQS